MTPTPGFSAALDDRRARYPCGATLGHERGIVSHRLVERTLAASLALGHSSPNAEVLTRGEGMGGALITHEASVAHG